MGKCQVVNDGVIQCRVVQDLVVQFKVNNGSDG